jgi:hypothetical protein
MRDFENSQQRVDELILNRRDLHATMSSRGDDDQLQHCALS